MFDIDNFLKSVGGSVARTDLFVSDTKRIDREKCAALVSWDPSLPAPSLDDVYAFARRTYAGAVVPQIATAKLHPHEHAISIVFTANQHQRSASDAQSMRKLSATLFAEDKTNSLWSLVSSQDGNRYLVRNIDEDIHDIVARAQRRNPHHPATTIASLRVAAPIVDKGDSVKFFGPKNQVLFGVITSLDGDFAKIKTPHDGQEYTVNRYAIAEITNKAPDAQARDKARLQDFLAMVWGSRELAEKATAVGTNDGGLGDRVPSFTT